MEPNTANLIHMILTEIMLPFVTLAVGCVFVWVVVSRLIRLRARAHTIRRRMDNE
ncbi:hypothetical protein LCGC14_2843960 [marine sediment metagenome]|uniref:Uncharacterized protein n=1 Tax=marine sediment metagenome TaxID=412755 RepID=A0A0F8YAJ4_9ZZZZ